VKNLECCNLGTDVSYYARRLAMIRWNILPPSSGSVLERRRQYVNPQGWCPLTRPCDFQTHKNTTQDQYCIVVHQWAHILLASRTRSHGTTFLFRYRSLTFNVSNSCFGSQAKEVHTIIKYLTLNIKFWSRQYWISLYPWYECPSTGTLHKPVKWSLIKVC
jgi:hypothetical protein